MQPGSAEDLARLRGEREEADRLYNDALTALDSAVQRMRELPQPPAAYDESRLGALNEQWDVLRAAPVIGSGWLRRFRAHAWATVAPLFERQQAFNRVIVEHLNHNVATHHQTAESIAGMLSVVREELERLVTFQTKLILWAQQITLYVDTKDRYIAGLPSGLAAAISGLSDEQQKRWESMLARERRYEAQVTDIRSIVGVLQRAVQTFKRELTRVEVPGSPGHDQNADAPSDGAVSPSALDSYRYVGFEDQFRGSPQQIRERLSAYIPEFEGARDVLDVGCGRGEFLELLRERGIEARGVDLNPEMAAICRERGLEATTADALSYLRSLPDASLGGLFAAQVVEHLEPAHLMRLLDTAYLKLKPGARIILETINPACWYAFFSSYIRDFTHVRPLHPDTLRYLLVASGFQRVDVRYTAPFPDEDKLQPVDAPLLDVAADADADPLATLMRTFNENVKTLNGLLFTYLDYAAVGERL